ncbi:unnamed protein product, partial [Amoebophrya sp. A120]
AVPSQEEVVAALRELKSGRAFAGPIPAEFARECPTVQAVLVALVRRIFRGDDLPPEWGEAVIAMLHKDGIRADPKNYRPIALISLGEKLVSLVILRRIEKGASKCLDTRQKGCRRGLSTRHAVFQLLRDIESSNKQGRRALYTFIDFAKAFDSLSWPVLHRICRQQGMPENICRILRDMYDRNARIKIRLGEEKFAAEFKQKCGIRQGSALSPLLFIICVDWAMKQFVATMVEEEFWTREEAEDQALRWLGYVDDLVIKSNCRNEAEFALGELASACRFVGLDLNVKKTKLMAVNPEAESRKNPEAMMERCALDGAEGWMIDWSGVDWADEWRREADRLPPASQSYNGLAPTHLIVWDDPASGVTAIASKMSGWATTQDGESIRLMRLGRKKHVLEARNEEVEAVPSFKYLGTEVAQDGTTDTEVARRCGIATGVVKQLQPIWRDRSLPPHLKAELYRSLSLSVVLYNAEAW